MKDHLLFIGSTGVLGRSFCETQAQRFDITGLSRAAHTPDMLTSRHVRANVTQCNWEAVLSKAAAEVGKPKHIVYSVFNRYDRYEWKDAPDWFIDTEITLHVTALLKLIRALFTYWPEDEQAGERTLTIVSSMAAVDSVKPDLFDYAAAKAAQNMIVRQGALLLPTARVMGICPNSFPAKIPTELICETITDLIEHGAKGNIALVRNATNPVELTR